jgi:hypothetical protein
MPVVGAAEQFKAKTHSLQDTNDVQGFFERLLLNYLPYPSLSARAKNTPKRIDPTKRGRFNLGEKQAYSRCKTARVETTKGSVFFDKRARRSL